MGSFLEYRNLVYKWVINGTNQDFFLKQFPSIVARVSWMTVCIADRRKTHIYDITPQAKPTVRGFPPWWETPMKYWETPADKLYMTKKYISCEPYTTFSLSYEQIHGDSPNNRQSGTFEFSNSTQTVFRWMKVSITIPWILSNQTHHPLTTERAPRDLGFLFPSLDSLPSEKAQEESELL